MPMVMQLLMGFVKFVTLLQIIIKMTVLEVVIIMEAIVYLAIHMKMHLCQLIVLVVIMYHKIMEMVFLLEAEGQL